MSHGHARSITARASQMSCAPIKPQLLRTGSLVIGAINGLLLLIISAGLIVSGVAYAMAISSVARDFFVGQRGSAGSGAIRDALWRARDRDAEPR
jgi:hypothetical protein